MYQIAGATLCGSMGGQPFCIRVI